ncbi:MAG: septal ring lytic transglycosylase RlpA family protein [Magnetococcales bacterium]|nr:septal ring lytic transglycosylase RlpA family protein [Magnetococcales bacterium]
MMGQQQSNTFGQLKGVCFLIAPIVVLLLLSGCSVRPNKVPLDTSYKHYTQLPKLSDRSFVDRKTRPYTIDGITYYPIKNEYGYSEEGIASWYGAKFHNRPTAIGERFDMFDFSAAHTRLPLPCLVRVTNLENGRSMIIRVNDRGPFVKNRLIDLSYSAARHLGYDTQGTASVRVEVVDPALYTQDLLPDSLRQQYVSAHAADRYKTPVPTRQKPRKTWKPNAISKQSDKNTLSSVAGFGQRFYVQVASFKNFVNAERLVKRLKDVGSARIQNIMVKERQFYRVSIGPYTDRSQAGGVVKALAQMGLGEKQIIAE